MVVHWVGKPCAADVDGWKRLELCCKPRSVFKYVQRIILWQSWRSLVDDPGPQLLLVGELR